MGPRIALGAVVIAAVAVAAMTQRSDVFGLHHDDGIYLSSAQSLAEGRGYTLPSLPGSPLATKYPPLYPLLLSVVVWWSGSAVAAVGPAQAANLALLAMALVLFYTLARRQFDDAGLALLLVASLGMSPVVVKITSFAMTDMLGLCLVLAFLVAWHTSMARSTRAALPTALTLLVALLATKAAAAALALAAAIHALRHRRFVVAALVATIALGWLVSWRAWQPAAPDSALLSYYQTYEPSLLAVARRDPGGAVEGIISNVRYYWDTWHLAVGPGWAFSPVAGLAVAGAWLLRGSVECLVALSWASLLLLYSGVAPRYALPLVPIYLLFATAGARRFMQFSRLSRSWLLAGLITLNLLSAVALWGFVVNRQHFPIDADRWRGFLEAAAWLKTHTPADAVVASGYDQVYFLAAGRRGVRPWRHNLYWSCYPYSHPVPDVGDPAVVRSDLLALGVDYLIVEPLNLHKEGREAEAMLKALVLLPPAATLLFTNEGGARQVYRLNSPERTPGPITP